MNSILKEKFDELSNCKDYECWYLVKQPTEFWKICYLVSFLDNYKKENVNNQTFNNYLKNNINKVNKANPDFNISNNYRTLRVAVFFGLMRMTSSKYEDALISETFYEIKDRCNGLFENYNVYQDIIDNQIEKIFLSSNIDEEYLATRESYRLYAVMLLYKILLELGRATNNYYVSMDEYRYLITTTSKYDEYLHTIVLILISRKETNQLDSFQIFKSKFDNRFIQAIKQLQCLEVDKNGILLKSEHIEDVKKKINLFESSNITYDENSYQDLLVSRNPLVSNFTGENRIVYGIPGCGKSYYVNHEILEKKCIDRKNDVFRTTFYLDYSNSDFVGQLLPVVDGDKITYKAIPGPFTKALKRAYENKNRMIYLIIEEINRGNAAAIFGDLFQLLDRLKKSKDGRYEGDSEYPITNEFIEGYFKEEKVDFIPGNIYIPRNLTIIATMNTSDQNVFPLDTAFKRRWKMNRITNKWDENHPFANHYIPFTDITWRTFVETINSQILNSSDDGLLLEDKQLGEFFADEEMFIEEKADECIVDRINKEKLESFTDKVIEYLYNDVFKFNKDKLFENKKSFNEIWEAINRYDDDTFKGSKKLCLKIDFNTTEVPNENTNHTTDGEEISGE